MKYEGPIAACFKSDHSSTIKNEATAFLNVALDAFYGHMFKTWPRVRSLRRIKKNAALSGVFCSDITNKVIIIITNFI